MLSNLNTRNQINNSILKTNYKSSDKVIVTRLPYFDKLPGIILSNSTDKLRNPITVMLDNNLGSWSFEYSEIALVGKESNQDTPNKAGDMQMVTEGASESESGISKRPKKKMPTAKGKRPYIKGGKPKDEKPKRKYQKKQ